MRKILVAGIALLATGVFLLLSLVIMVFQYGIGASGNPSLSSPTVEIIRLYLRFSIFWWIFLIGGIILIVAGSVRRNKE